MTVAHTLYLAAAGGDSTDPWHVLGSTYDQRLAVAALADLTLARRIGVAPEADGESPAARRLGLAAGPRLGGAIDVALDTLAASSRELDIDRAIHMLRDVTPAIEADLVASGHLGAAGQRGVFKKRTVLVAHPQSVAAAQARIRSADPAWAESRALTLCAVAGLSARRAERLLGGPLAVRHDPFEPFHPASPAPDGQPLGDNAADLLTALVTVLAATSDSMDDFD